MITIGQEPHVEARAVVEQLARLDWDFAGADTVTNGHGFHPYPAKFPPQLPRQVIEELSERGELIVDPFCGSGTSALEAVRLGRRIAAIDANPVGVRLTRVKVHGIGTSDIDELHRFSKEAKRLIEEPCPVEDSSCAALRIAPAIPNIEKWFAPVTIHELCHLRTLVENVDGIARDVAELAIGQTAARCSFQESETRYVSRKRLVLRGEALRRFVVEIENLIQSIPRRSPGSDESDMVAIEGDARSLKNWQAPADSAALVVTSPPYPNAYDYHLYHRFRLLWTGGSPAELRSVEIGSHLRQQSVKDPVRDYENDMWTVMANALHVLKPGGWLVLVVGDGKYKGEIYRTSESIASLGRALGFEVGGAITRNLPATRRSVTVAGRRLQQEQIVFLRKPGAIVIAGPAWQMVSYEEELAAREAAILATRSPQRMHHLTFARSIAVDGEVLPTVQGLLEAADGGRRKNSTYATHGIHRYKGKFYPQLGRCLINLSSEEGDLILDPFAGSGTVGLESTLLGRRFHGIELSPVGAATAQAKITLMSARLASLSAASTEFGRLDTRTGSEEVHWEQFEHETLSELQSWFSRRILARISRVLVAISDLESGESEMVRVGHAARVCLSDLIREVSHQDPSDLRIRRRKDPPTDAPLESMFIDKWNETVRRALSARSVVGSLDYNATIIQGDSADQANWPGLAGGSIERIDAVVSSPPYAAALPYLDTDRLSIAAVFGGHKQQRAGLESRLIGSREMSSRDLHYWNDLLNVPAKFDVLPGSTLSFLGALREAVLADPEAGFRKRQSPAVLTRYFVGMSRVLAEISSRLRPNGEVWYVVGDSRTTIGGVNWVVPTTEETAAIAKHNGLVFVESIPITVTRENMRHSKNAITKNTLLHFQKP